MRPTARHLILLTLALVLWLSLNSPVQAGPAEYQTCTRGKTCTVGEFLYDDNYVSIATASCNFTSRDPTGGLFLDHVVLPPTSDGWYAYTLTPLSQTEGLYRSQLCCLVDGDNMCIDKSFTIKDPPSSLTSGDVENAVWNASTASHSATGSFGEQVNSLQNTNPQAVANAVWNSTPSAYITPGTFGNTYTNLSTLTAGAVWNYTTRSLSTFGDLIASIWDYNTRSLTSFGDLISGIWNHTDRSLTQNVTTDTSGLANKNDVTDIKNQLEKLKGTGLNYQDQELLKKIAGQVVENRDILDALINQPIVETSLEDSAPPDLSVKIDKTKQVTNDLYATVQQLDSRVGLITLKWTTLSASARRSELEALIGLIGSPKQPTDTNTVVSNAGWYQDAWGGQIGTQAVDFAATARDELTAAKNSLDTNPQTTLDHLKNSSAAIASLEKVIGDVSSLASDTTMFGRLKEVTALAQKLDQNDQQIDKVLTSWNGTNAFKRQQDIKAMRTNVLAINHLSNATALLDRAGDKPEYQEKNQVLGLKAVNVVNRLLLAVMKGKPVKSVWLEEGSVIFRTVITNPSERISQKVPVKYFLPKEVSKEDIIKADPELKLDFDPTVQALAVTGNFELEPNETRTYMVEVNDIWAVKKEDLESLRLAADELTKPLLKTAFYGQGAALKSEINVTLDKIASGLATDRPPDARIRFYREAQIELAGVQMNLDTLKSLVAQAGNTKSVVGYVGGISTLAVWGIITIILLGFGVLVYYFRYLKPAIMANYQTYQTASSNPISLTLPLGKHAFRPAEGLAYASTEAPVSPVRRRRQSSEIRATRFFQILVIMLSTTILTLSALNIRSTATKKMAKTADANPPSAVLGATAVNPTPLPPSADNPLPVNIIIPLGDLVLLRDQPSADSAILMHLTHSTPARLVDRKNGYVQVEFTLVDTPITGWIADIYISPRN